MSSNHSDSTENSKSTAVSRRPFLKAAAGLGTVGLAGCSGGGGSDKGGSGSGSGSKNGQAKNKAPEFTLVDNALYQSGSWAVDALKEAIKKWEKKTGGTIHLETKTVRDLLTAFKNKNQPHMLMADPDFVATAVQQDLIRPVDSYKDTLPRLSDSDPKTGFIDGMKERNQRLWQGFGKPYVVPLVVESYAPFLGNMEHFRKTPGLSPEEDFPPKNLSHLIEVAKKLDKDGPAEIGYQMVGKQGDQIENWMQLLLANDEINEGFGGKVFDVDDWSKTIINNETWSKTLEKYFQIYKKHDIGAPNTLQINHEATVPMMISGKVSLSMQPADSNPTFYNRGKDMFQPRGPLKWGTTMGLNSGVKTSAITFGGAFPKSQPDVSESEWQNAQKGALDFLNFMMTGELFSDTLPSKAGAIPCWKKPYNNIAKNKRTQSGGWLENAVYGVIDESSKLMGPPAHPEYYTAKIEKIPPYMTKCLKGEIDAETATNKAHDKLQSYLDTRTYPWDK